MNKSEYAKGGAIYKGDKVKIKGSNKSMVVKNIAKGKKGYVEFTGDAGTYLKGDLEKFAKGGGVGDDLEWVVEYLMPTEDNYRVEKGFESEEQARRWVKGERIDKEAENISIHPIKKFAEGGSIYAKGGSTFDYYDGSGAKDITELGLDDLKFQLKHTTKPYEKERVALLKKLIAQKESKKMAKGGKMYAKGGLTEHGLRTGDSLGKSADNSVIVYPYNKDERSPKVVNLNVGKRIDAKEYSSMDEKGRDKFTKMAKGGSIKVNLGSGEMDLENAIKMYENKIKSQGRVTNERDENMLKQLKSMRPKMAKGGGVAFKPYGKTKGLYSITYSENGEAQSETWESLEMAMDRVKRLKKMSNVSNVKLVKPKMAKGGAIDTAKSMWSKKNKRFRANMLEKVGYSSGVANDLSFEEWDSLEKGVHIRLATLFSNKKTSTMAKGGKTKSKQDPPVIRGYVDDEPYEYGDGGTMNCWCYEIGGL